jgi:catechol 2,3-dioxygenase-like lactoylglutathione lyase family enzyme
MLLNGLVSATIPAADFKRARQFYEQKLGFKPIAEDPSPGIMYRTNQGSLFYLYYQKNFAKCDHTALSFIVDNVESEVKELKTKGIKFEEYDIPEMDIKTVNGIASFAGLKGAWFKDTETNIIAISELSKSTTAKIKKQMAGVAA